MKYYGVCLVTSDVIFLGEFDDPDDAGEAAYVAPGAFVHIPMNENDLLKLLLRATETINVNA